MTEVGRLCPAGRETRLTLAVHFSLVQQMFGGSFSKLRYRIRRAHVCKFDKETLAGKSNVGCCSKCAVLVLCSRLLSGYDRTVTLLLYATVV